MAILWKKTYWKVSVLGRNHLAVGCDPKVRCTQGRTERSVRVHSQRRTQGAPSSSSTPSCGWGQDLGTPRLISLPPSWTGESLVHPSVSQVGDKLGLFTPEVESKGKGDFPGQSSSLVLDLSRNHAFILHLPQKAAAGWHWHSPFTLHCKGLLYQPSWNNAAFLIAFSILTEIRDLCWDFCLWHAKKFLQESRLRRQSMDEWDNSSITGGQSGWSGLKSIAQGDAGGVWKRQRSRCISSIQDSSLFS